MKMYVEENEYTHIVVLYATINGLQRKQMFCFVVCFSV